MALDIRAENNMFFLYLIASNTYFVQIEMNLHEIKSNKLYNVYFLT